MFSNRVERLKHDFNISTFQTLVVSVVIIINVTCSCCDFLEETQLIKLHITGQDIENN